MRDATGCYFFFAFSFAGTRLPIFPTLGRAPVFFGALAVSGVVLRGDIVLASVLVGSPH